MGIGILKTKTGKYLETVNHIIPKFNQINK